MLSLQNVKSSGGALRYFSKDNYYTKEEQNEAPAEYVGTLKEDLGADEITRENLKNYLEGNMNGETVNSEKRKHRPGYDLTFSASKSVSIAAYAIDDNNVNTDMKEAHATAVKNTLSYIEDNYVKVRNTKNGVTRTEKTGKMLAACFAHDTTRGVERDGETYIDPQMHTHAVIINATKDDSGTWRAIANDDLYTHKKMLGAVYRSELARELQERGYETTQDRNGIVELRGVTEELKKEFSQRRQQIEQYMKEHNLSGAKEAEKAVLNTRNNKISVDRDELVQDWKDRAKEHNLSRDTVQKTQNRYNYAERTTDAVKYALETVTERSSYFTKEDILREALQVNTGVTARECDRAFHNQVQEKTILQRDNEHYTTPDVLRQEVRIVRAEEQTRGRYTHTMNHDDVSAVISEYEDAKGFSLSSGQSESVHNILQSDNQIVGVQGYAGTGKTTMLEAVKQAADTHGYTVKGYAPSAAAAKVMQEETGIPSQTVDKHLYDKKYRTGKREIWIVDEASMLSTKKADRLLHKARVQGAKVVLQGDTKQLAAVEAGSPFKLLQERGMHCTEMKEIRRQKDPDLLQSVKDTIDVKIDRALARYADNKRVTIQKDRNARIQDIVSKYNTLSPEDQKETLIITSRNRDKNAINTAIRRTMQQAGTLSRQEQSTDMLVKKNVTQAELTRAHTYETGDVIRFSRSITGAKIDKGEYGRVQGSENGRVIVERSDGKSVHINPAKDHELFREESRALAAGEKIRFTRNTQEFKNGERATIEAVNGDKLTVSVKGKRHDIDVKQYRHIDHAYACTVHASQGASCKNALVNIDTDCKKLTGRESFYVSVSRAKENLQLYTDDYNKLPGTVIKSNIQVNVLDGHDRSRAKGMTL